VSQVIIKAHRAGQNIIDSIEAIATEALAEYELTHGPSDAQRVKEFRSCARRFARSFDPGAYGKQENGKIWWTREVDLPRGKQITRKCISDDMMDELNAGLRHAHLALATREEVTFALLYAAKNCSVRYSGAVSRHSIAEAIAYETGHKCTDDKAGHIMALLHRAGLIVEVSSKSNCNTRYRVAGPAQRLPFVAHLYVKPLESDVSAGCEQHDRYREAVAGASVTVLSPEQGTYPEARYGQSPVTHIGQPILIDFSAAPTPIHRNQRKSEHLT
jgi:hypothetical protein